MTSLYTSILDFVKSIAQYHLHYLRYHIHFFVQVHILNVNNCSTFNQNLPKVKVGKKSPKSKKSVSLTMGEIQNLTDFVQIWYADVESRSLAPHQKIFGKVTGQGQGHENGEKYASDYTSWTRYARHFWFGPTCTKSLCASYAHGASECRITDVTVYVNFRFCQIW